MLLLYEQYCTLQQIQTAPSLSWDSNHAYSRYKSCSQRCDYRAGISTNRDLNYFNPVLDVFIKHKGELQFWLPKQLISSKASDVIGKPIVGTVRFGEIHTQTYSTVSDLMKFTPRPFCHCQIQINSHLDLFVIARYREIHIQISLPAPDLEKFTHRPLCLCQIQFNSYVAVLWILKETGLGLGLVVLCYYEHCHNRPEDRNKHHQ